MYVKDTLVSYVHYWEQIHSQIMDPAPLTPTLLQEGFWLMTNWQWDHACSVSFGVGHHVSPNTTPEDDPKPYPYMVRLKRSQSFALIPIEMFSLETLCFVDPVTDIASLCGLVAQYQL